MRPILTISFSLLVALQAATSSTVIAAQAPNAVNKPAQAMMSKSQMTDKCKADGKDLIQYARCLDGIRDRLDRELQTWQNNHVFELTEAAKSTGRHSALNMFKKSGKSFKTYRENTCRWYYLNRLPLDDANVHYKKCYIRLTKGRIAELAQEH